ncbi:hypothetical protein HMSSN036_61760 [Paenibacillus macerans]|nr:hypothetical protein HMSSN036_61760 [Paenibacillus macerans]
MTERELFDCYNKDVYRTCYYMLRNAQDAEDVCHDVFVTVFRQDWQRIEHVRAWIMRITMNHCLNLLRKTGRSGRSNPRCSACMSTPSQQRLNLWTRSCSRRRPPPNGRGC